LKLVSSPDELFLTNKVLSKIMKRKNIFDHESSSTSSNSTSKNSCINEFFFPIFDQEISSLNRRFKHLKQFNEALYGSSDIITSEIKNIMEKNYDDVS
jgi:hypothetical protein